jgi:hypothetical protein
VKVDSSKIVAAIVIAILAGLGSYYAQPLVHDNADAINIIATVFSVLAGFLVAIIAIVGDPVLLPPGSWRAAELERDKLKAQLARHKWLFFSYLITLALVFATLLLKNVDETLTLWLERTFLFFGLYSFALSFALPSALMKVQQERIDAVIEHRRSNENLQTPPGVNQQQEK